MTETTNKTNLPAPVQRFILHWGDMGGQWGVNRSVAQIHALLYVSARPMHAEEIAAALAIARSNVSNSLKELQSWRLIRRTPVAGDRRDHFEAEGDVWEMMRRIVEGRKEREFDPAAALLREVAVEASADSSVPETARRRIGALNDLVAEVDGWAEEMRHVPLSTVRGLVRLGGKVVRVLGLRRGGA